MVQLGHKFGNVPVRRAALSHQSAIWGGIMQKTHLKPLERAVALAKTGAASSWLIILRLLYPRVPCSGLVLEPMDKSQAGVAFVFPMFFQADGRCGVRSDVDVPVT